MTNASSGPGVSRRQALTRIGALGAGATAVAATRTRGFAQPKAPITLSFWTFDNPQQRPWLHKRVNQYMEKNPNVKVDFQWFTFADLGKKVSVGYATGTAPDGFVTGDWLMPTWLARNPIVSQVGGQWFDASGKCTLNNEAGVKAMTIRASIARQYGAEDPADSIATFPLPQMDWLKERCSMFSCHPIPPVAIKSQNPVMESEGYFLPVQMAGVTADKRYTTCYGFNFVVNARAPKDKQEALHDMYRFIMSDLVDCWQATAPFTLARKTGWTDDPRVKSFPHVGEIIKAKDNGVFFPRTPIWTELADAMHRAVQKVMLNNADIKAALDEAAAEVDRATAEFKKA